jgi:hypothetical protein
LPVLKFKRMYKEKLQERIWFWQEKLGKFKEQVKYFVVGSACTA